MSDLDSLSDLEEAPLIARPPSVDDHRDGFQLELEVSSSPAFLYLNELLQAGKLSGTEVARLKAKYSDLYERLKESKSSEQTLLEQAKRFTSELQQQDAIMLKAGEFPEGTETETSELRKQFLKYNNDINALEERNNQLSFRIESMMEEKKLLEREYERIPKEEDIKRQTEELTKSTEELRREILQRQEEMKQLNELIEEKGKILLDRREISQIHSIELDNVKEHYLTVNSQPSQLSKESEKLNRQMSYLSRDVKSREQEYEGYRSKYEQVAQQRESLEKEKDEMETMLKDLQAQVRLKDQETQALEKEQQFRRDEEMVLNEDKGMLEFSLKQKEREKRLHHDTVISRQKEKENYIRALKRAELQLKGLQDQLAHFELLYEKRKAIADSYPRDDGTVDKKKKDSKKEIEAAKKEEKHVLAHIDDGKNSLDKLIARQAELLYEQSDMRIEEKELERLKSIKNDEREEKAREYAKLAKQHSEVLDELKSKAIVLNDYKKQHRDLQLRIREFAVVYDAVKTERNHLVKQNQVSLQQIAELKEKLKILENELEILRTTASQRERRLYRQQRKVINNMLVRDTLRTEVAKQQQITHELVEENKQQKLEISNLNSLIDRAEKDMTNQRKLYESYLQQRNERSVQVIERNEEVAIFQERINIQDNIGRKANYEMKSRDEEIRFLQMKIDDHRRANEILKKCQFDKRRLEKELVNMQIQLEQTKEQLLKLEQLAEDGEHDHGRVRVLDEKEDVPQYLEQKTEQLEVSLAEKEEQCLEKDLIYDQVLRMLARIEDAASKTQADALTLAKSVNEMQRKIKGKNRKLMANVAELSVLQAQALQMQQEIKGKETFLEQCYKKMERGEPPSEQLEAEWERLMMQQQQRDEERDLGRTTTEEEEQYLLADGTRTTAEPRPNAYIPDDDVELPVPKPYGGHAPFKPSESGANIRHIRKPQPKPIEI